MSQAESFIKAIQTIRDNHTREALQASSGTEFDYGRVCGIHQGLEMALRAVEKTLDATDSRTSSFEKNLRGKHDPIIRS